MDITKVYKEVYPDGEDGDSTLTRLHVSQSAEVSKEHLLDSAHRLIKARKLKALKPSTRLRSDKPNKLLCDAHTPDTIEDALKEIKDVQEKERGELILSYLNLADEDRAMVQDRAADKGVSLIQYISDLVVAGNVAYIRSFL